MLKKAKKYYYEVAKSHANLRKEFLVQRAEEFEAEGLMPQATAYRQLAHKEEMRKINRLIKSTKPSKSSKLISQVQAPPLHYDIHDTDKDTENFSAKEEVERAFLQHLDRRFSQAYATTPLSDQVINSLGLFGTTEDAKAILRGDPIPVDYGDPYLDQLLAHMNRPPYRPTFDGRITAEQYQSLWRVKKERTSSSPRNGHFGHFKAIADHNGLSEIMAQVLSIGLCSGTTPSQYRMMTACLLEKSQVCPKWVN